MHKAGGLNWSSVEMLGSQGRNGLASKVRASRQRAQSPPSMSVCRLPQGGVARIRFNLISHILTPPPESRFRLKVCVCLPQDLHNKWISPGHIKQESQTEVCSVLRFSLNPAAFTLITAVCKSE